MAATSNQIFTSTPNANNVRRPSDILREFSSTPITQNGGIVGNRPSLVARRQLRKTINTNVAYFECGYCAQTFKLECNLMLHEQIHQLNNHKRKDRDEPFSCVVCGMRFGLKSEMDRHREDHMEKVVERCSYCNKKKYGNEEHLQRHERIHEWIDSLKEHEPFVCTEFELIFQSKSTDESPMDNLQMQSNSQIKMEIQTENDGVKLQSDSDKSNESNLITVSISSDNDSNVDNSPVPEVRMTRSKSRFMAKNHVTDSTSVGFELDKRNFKCTHCELVFEQSCDKLKHECQFHTPKVVLPKWPIEVATDVITMSINVDVQLNSFVPETSQNQKKTSKMKQKSIDRMKKNKPDEKLEHHDKTTDKVRVATSHWLLRPKFYCSECKQRFTSNEKLDIHRMTAHATEDEIELIQNEISQNDIEQCNQLSVDELDVSNAIIEPEIAKNNSEIDVQSSQQKTIEKMFKCTHCHFTFSQIDDQMKHECHVHSCRIFLRKIQDDAALNGINKTHIKQSLEPKDDEFLPHNDDTESKEIENCMPIELEIDICPDTIQKWNNNKRKRSTDENGRRFTDDSGKRMRLVTNPVVIEQQFNNNLTTANNINLEFSDVSKQKSIAVRKSKENIQQLQKEPQQQKQKHQQKQQRQQQLQHQNQQQEQQSSIGGNTRDFWKKQFLGIHARQLTVVTVPTPRRMSNELTLTGLIDMKISDCP